MKLGMHDTGPNCLPFEGRIRIFPAREMAFSYEKTAGNRLMMPI
jgi:hypothetical protein